MFQLPTKKRILGIFAHPDDDVFGPGGTLIRLSANNEIYEIFLTNGESGTNQINGKKDKDLGEKRKGEAKASGKIIGVKKMYFFNYKDGSLCNLFYHEIAKKIQNLIDKHKIDLILTYEPKGVSGHIDHVFASMVSSYVAEQKNLKIWYFCLSQEQRRFIKNYFIYFPTGYKKDKTMISVDINQVLDQKIRAIKCHRTQIKDVGNILKNLKNPAFRKEFFILS